MRTAGRRGRQEARRTSRRVLENGGVVGVEVKASASVTAADFGGLRKLATAAGDDFRIGVVLYDGDETLPFGDRLWAAPISALWAAN